MRLLFIADFSEQFPNRVLRGIRKYSQEAPEPWVVCKMPTSYMETNGFNAVLSWARSWRANVVLATFRPEHPVEEFRKNGIAAVAMDYIQPFCQIPNLTGEDHRIGEMVARDFVSNGFRYFAYFGYHGICWSDARRRGFMDYLDAQGLKDNFQEGIRVHTATLWSYDESKLGSWLQSLPKPVGIMACDDNQANILLECCRTFDIRVPAEVAVIGVDNDEMLCTMTDPQISSVNVDLEGLVVLADHQAVADAFQIGPEGGDGLAGDLPDDDTFKVHVHTDTPGAALTESQKYGTLELAKIENMRTQAEELAAGKKAQSTDDLEAIEAELEAMEQPGGSPVQPAKRYGVVIVTSTSYCPGLAVRVSSGMLPRR